MTEEILQAIEDCGAAEMPLEDVFLIAEVAENEYWESKTAISISQRATANETGDPASSNQDGESRSAANGESLSRFCGRERKTTAAAGKLRRKRRRNG